MDDVITAWPHADDDERLWLTFNAISKVPELPDIALVPVEMDEIITSMEAGEIPMNASDIPVNGDDVMTMFDIPKSKRVGEILEIMRKAAQALS